MKIRALLTAFKFIKMQMKNSRKVSMTSLKKQFKAN